MRETLLFIVCFAATVCVCAQAGSKDTEDAEIKFTKVEITARYKAGKEAFQRYVKENLRYPKVAREKKIAGTVTVKFIVTSLGMKTQVEAVSGPALLRAEALRLMNESGEWLPAVQCGRPVKAFVTENIKFVL